MNDPGLDKPISDSQDNEKLKGDEHDAAEEDEEAMLEPNSWWLASTAFPLIAGTFGPMASAFSLCALVVHWRVYIPPGASETTGGTEIEDPKWLIGINAAQLVIALTANFFLLLNMAQRVRFSIAQPVTIIGWYLSSFTLVGLCACASGPLLIEPRDRYAFSQAYYYAAFAAVIYFIVATLMLGTVYGAWKDYYPKEFQLTMPQRTLMLQTISFLTYLIAGAAVFGHIEGWALLDALYWADVTLLTVGLGDFSPSTHTGRALLFPFAIGGIIIIGLVIGSIRSLVLERGAAKMDARRIEKERRRIVEKVQKKTDGEILKPVTDDQAPIAPDTREEMTERDRREREFTLMRTILRRAHKRQLWISLVVWGSSTMVLWLAGAAVFQATESAQGWSYFMALYFSYTSLLTIGYGDFYPTSNSGKPFFVLWSLLAIPSLTIVISKMGDTIVKEVEDLTLWIANITILPGEKGVRSALKEGATKLSGSKIFSGRRNLFTPPGILGEMGNRDSDSEDEGEARNEPDSAAQRALGDRAENEQKGANKFAKEGKQLPEDKHEYHVLLIKEIGKVMKHLRSSPPRQYTYDEWSWYLKLIGEDEGSADLHREPNTKPTGEGKGLGTGVGQKQGNDKVPDKWSWVGERSPLMGGKEEAEWVLERLVKNLEWALEGNRRANLEKRRETPENPEGTIEEKGNEGKHMEEHGSSSSSSSQQDKGKSTSFDFKKGEGK
ncbi:Outward-rectifier potassium channel TOK1 [Lachnellula suecica]|uniref:Outward-rectifier potassium channel TOK1 n=1 Tax=Lachnellula suecica TaxID=602035 RepID=A0A8T9CJC0_9HELO|nr:Outward-rectifier potassium channel TOK1 [Lachnellula suecica]